jgi:hypothetical protein
MDRLDQLLQLEEEFWQAAGDRRRYERNLAADAIHVFPGWGVANREAVLAGVAEADPWQGVEIDAPQVISLDGGAAALVYTASAQRSGQPPYEAAITSVYRCRGMTWELVVHQQTPLAAP